MGSTRKPACMGSATWSFDDFDFEVDCASSKVKRATLISTGIPVVCKTIRVEDAHDRTTVLKEIQSFVNSHECPNLVKYYGAFQASRWSLHMVMEFMDLGSLRDLTA